MKPVWIIPASILLLTALACNTPTSPTAGPKPTSTLSPTSGENFTLLPTSTPLPSLTLIVDESLERQWASEAAAAAEDINPSQATGTPDTTGCVVQSTAWAALNAEPGSGDSWIQLHYRTAVLPTEINIVQSANPGGITGVQVEGSGGARVIYSGEQPTGGKCPETLTIPVEVDFAVDTILILVAASENPTYIDAVELVGRAASLTNIPVFWRIPVPGNTSPGLMDVDPLGDVYLAAGQGGVYIFDWEGNGLDNFPPGEGSLIADVKMDLYGNLLLADPTLNQVYVTSPGGERLGSFGRQGAGDGDFGPHSPLALEVSPYTNNFYILNENASGTQIQVFDGNDGRFIHFFSLEGGVFKDMDFSEDNLLYVVDQTNATILKIDPESGQVLDRLGAEALAHTTPRGITLDAAGNIYVSVNSSDRGAAIYVLDPQGGLERLLGKLTNAADTEWPEGTFFDPGGIAVTSDGSFLFLCDGKEGRVYLTAYKLKD